MPMQKYAPLLSFIAILALTATVYAIGLNGPFVFDDVQNLAPLNQWLQGDLSWQRVALDNTSGRFGRPISMASFVLNVWAFGPVIWGFKLGNLVVHLFNGVLVYLLFAALLRRGALAGDASRNLRWLPVLGAAIWLLHPLLVSTVLYVVQRMAMLSATFMLLGMLAYLHGRTALEQGRSVRVVAWLALGVPLCTLLAALSKENGVLVPALCGVIELFAFAPAQRQRRPWLSRAVIAATLLLPALVVAALLAAHHPAIFAGYDNRPFTLGERLLTQGRVLWHYIGALLLPYGPSLGLYHDDFPTSHGLMQPTTTLLALVAWVLTLVCAWRLRRTIPGFALGLGIFLVGQSLESSVFPLLMYFEHRNYLPAVGAIWALLSLATWASLRLRLHLDHGYRIAVFGAVALVAGLALATAARSSIWQTNDSLLAQSLTYHPKSRWLRSDLAQQAMQRKPPDVVAARQHIDALLDSDEPSTRRMAGVYRLLIDCSTGELPQSSSIDLAFGGRAKAIEADLLLAIESVADGVMTRPCRDLDARHLAVLISTMTDHAMVPANDFNIQRLRFKTAQLYLAAGEPRAALAQARLGYDGSLSGAPIGAFLAGLEIQNGNPAQGRALLQHLQAQVPQDNAIGRSFLASLELQLRDVENRQSPKASNEKDSQPVPQSSNESGAPQ